MGKRGPSPFVRRAVHARLYPADGPSPQQLVADGDDALFERIQTNEHHLLRELLPITNSHKYALRSRRHNFTLNNKSETDDRNFVTRLLLRTYVLTVYFTHSLLIPASHFVFFPIV